MIFAGRRGKGEDFCGAGRSAGYFSECTHSLFASAMEGAMLKVVRWYNGAPRVEINQRARDTRLRLERIKRLLAPRAAVTDPGSGGPFVF